HILYTFPKTHPTQPTSTLVPYTTLFRSSIHAIKSPQPCPQWWSHPHFIIRTLPSIDVCIHTYIHFPEWRRCRRTVRWQTRIYWADRKSTRLNSSHVAISYAVFCLKKKTT